MTLTLSARRAQSKTAILVIRAKEFQTPFSFFRKKTKLNYIQKKSAVLGRHKKSAKNLSGKLTISVFQNEYPGS